LRVLAEQISADSWEISPTNIKAQHHFGCSKCSERLRKTSGNRAFHWFQLCPPGPTWNSNRKRRSAKSLASFRFAGTNLPVRRMKHKSMASLLNLQTQPVDKDHLRDAFRFPTNRRLNCVRAIGQCA